MSARAHHVLADPRHLHPRHEGARGVGHCLGRRHAEAPGHVQPHWGLDVGAWELV